MSDVIHETDSDLEDDDQEEAPPRKEVEIGSYKAHLETTKKGLLEYKIWHNINYALIAMAHQNSYHRIDLRDIDMLKRLEKDLNLRIDYDFIKNEIDRNPWLVAPNGEKAPTDRTRNEQGKPLSKKELKNQAKRDKIQKKIDALKLKYKNIKNKKCDRAIKNKQATEELETKRDRV